MRKKLEIPKIKQLPGGYCGPACLSMVFDYLGKPMTQKEISKHIKENEDIKEYGVYHHDLVQAARDIGFVAHPSRNLNLDSIVDKINKDIPIVARCKYHNKRKFRHYYLITGYDSDSREVFVNDPWDLRKSKFDYSEFRDIWYVKGEYGTKNYGIMIRKK